MSAGVSAISPVVIGTPASRTQYEPTPVSPTVQKATVTASAEMPSKFDPSKTEPRPANNGLTGFSFYA